MRAVPPWRSLVCLAAPALLVAACAPRVAVSGRPPPCAPETTLCQSTGRCVPTESLTDADGGASAKAACDSMTVRQGLSIDIPVPGAKDTDIQLVSADDVTAEVVWLPPDDPVVRVTAPHGTYFGDHTREGLPRAVRFHTLSDGVKVEREVGIAVSPIAASVYGSDDAIGTTERPFRHFAKAAAAAGRGDTIKLSNGPNGAAADDTTEVRLPAGVTVQGQDVGGTRLLMNVTLLGDATLEDLFFFRNDAFTNNQRLLITKPGSHVVLRDVITAAGVEVDERAIGTNLEISGGTTEIRTDDGMHAPLLVAADSATVTIGTLAKVVFTGKEQTDDETMLPIRMTGAGQHLTISGGAKVANNSGPIAISVEGNSDTFITGASVQGLFDVGHELATATVVNTELSMAQGEGGIRFAGHQLDVINSRFKANGIEQSNAASVVTVRGTTFSKYSRFAYHLIAGHADLGDGANPGGNEFILPVPTPSDAPTALVNDAAATVNGVMTNNFITVSAARYNFPASLPDLPCTMTGLTQAPLYRLAKDAQLYFY